MKEFVDNVVNNLSKTMTTYEIIRHCTRNGDREKLIEALPMMPKYHEAAFRIALNYFPVESRQTLWREHDENRDIIYEMRGE